MYKKNRNIANAVTPYPYRNPAVKTIPVIAKYPWTVWENDTWQPPTEQYFKNLEECGFNTAVILTSRVDYVSEALSLAAKHEIACILQQYYNLSNEKMEDFVSKLKNSPNLAGIVLKEEPYFDDINSSGDITKMYKWIVSNNIPCMVYLDLAYSMDSRFVGPDIKNYDAYLTTVNQFFKPVLWSYGYNPVISKNGATYSMNDSFFAALDSYSKIAKATSTRFWARCDCDSYFEPEYYRPAPSLGTLRFEAFSSLAYGAQGLVFKDYAQHVSSEFITAPVDLQKERTDLWYIVQAVISEIARYSEVFLGCTVTKLFHVNGSSGVSNLIPENTEWPLTEVAAENNKGVAVSLIKNKTYENGPEFNYVAIVSKDPFHTQKVKICYKANYTSLYKVVEITPNFMQDGTLSAPAGAPTSVSTKTLTLDPGGYAIIRWRK